MDTKNFEVAVASTEQPREAVISELNALELALVGGGCGDVSFS